MKKKTILAIGIVALFIAMAYIPTGVSESETKVNDAGDDVGTVYYTGLSGFIKLNGQEKPQPGDVITVRAVNLFYSEVGKGSMNAGRIVGRDITLQRGRLLPLFIGNPGPLGISFIYGYSKGGITID